MATPSQDVLDKREKNRIAAAKYREKHRDYYRERMRKWREENRDIDRHHKREYRNRILTTGTPEQVAAFRAAESANARRNHERNKDAVFGAYGGYICKCCGETEKAFLSIDHINNDGYKDRKAKLYGGNGTGFYCWLKKNKFPDGFQVLCMNCQFGKKKHGICPHQVRKV